MRLFRLSVADTAGLIREFGVEAVLVDSLSKLEWTHEQIRKAMFKHRNWLVLIVGFPCLVVHRFYRYILCLSIHILDLDGGLEHDLYIFHITVIGNVIIPIDSCFSEG